jgi:hypothetical protein
MSHDDLDRMLREDDIVPSTSFVANVMVAVRRENSTPAPISFPWRWAAPGVAGGVITLVTLFIAVILQLGRHDAVVAGPMPRVFVVVAEEANAIGVGWIAMALLVWFASMWIVRTAFHRDSGIFARRG